MTDIEYLTKYSSEKELETNLKRLKNGEPVQYILGKVNFYGYDLEVNQDCLIPRFETEELIEKTLKLLKEINLIPKSILDIGTGSGAIAITLKNQLPDTIVTASDISSKALKVAKKNIQKHNLDINLINSNCFENIEETFDLIISNPPYIANNGSVMGIVKNNEPHIALFAGDEGLDMYIEILNNINKHLNSPSLIAFEIGMDQGSKLTNIIKEKLPNSQVILDQDLTGKDRFIFIVNK